MKTPRIVIIALSILFLLIFLIVCGGIAGERNGDDDFQTVTDHDHPNSTETLAHGEENTELITDHITEEAGTDVSRQETEDFESSEGTEMIGPEIQETEPIRTPYPWEEAGAKKPAEYTWEEFEALSPEHQIAFQNAFENIEAFDAWLNKAQSSGHAYPWDEAGAKQPAEYTWDEFEALSPEHQIAFQNEFENIEAFDAWLQKAQSSRNPYPWEEAGAKQPSEYTWDEFNNLSAEHQIAFQFAFESFEDFDKWLTANKPD